jgi:hypothetical protein
MEALRARGRSRGVVHAARAYLAGVGTTGSLLAAAALVFIVASALVAFHGWPHVAVQQSPSEVVISPRSASTGATPVARRLAVVAAAPATGGHAGRRRADVLRLRDDPGTGTVAVAGSAGRPGD